GPGQTGRYGMVVPRFVQQALRQEPLRVFGTGEQTRCFCHVSDTVRALITLLDKPEQTAGEIYNIGSSEEVSINTLAQRVIDLADSPSPITHIPYSEAYAPGFEDMQRRVPDTTKLRRAIDWTPRHQLNDILTDVLAYERERLTRT
ncbi:MAG: NAD-dependent epimerase/dehydratase family protein, partial [Caldilineaceae bacterium]|nr:NAD-dependent epimerase/dehydratase family protein [Caldilineaceae bacterium]